MPDEAIDRGLFAELQDTAGADFVVELVDTFLEDAPEMLASLRAAAAGDADAFRRNAHTLKSNATTFGALALAAQARELEHRGLAHYGADAVAAVAVLEALYQAAAAELKALCHA